MQYVGKYFEDIGEVSGNKIINIKDEIKEATELTAIRHGISMKEIAIELWH